MALVYLNHVSYNYSDLSELVVVSYTYLSRKSQVMAQGRYPGVIAEHIV